MNRSVYEGKFLLNLVGGTLRQDESFPVMRNMNWARLYRIAEYHEITSAVYLGMLSVGARVPALFGERFFQRYQEAVHYGEIYEASELEILSVFQAFKVPAIILESAAVRRLYQLPETAANSPLRVYIPEESYYLAKGYLVDLGYITDEQYKGFGESMRRVAGFRVELYHTLPYLTKTYKNCMKGILNRAYPDKQNPALKVLSLESSYLFRIAEASYHFCSDSLRVRELLDLYLFYKLFNKDMNRRFLDARIKELNIGLLSQTLLHMADMWFSSRNNSLFPYPKEDISLYDDMESRILSNGMVGRDSISEAIKLRKEIRNVEDQEERVEKWRKWKDKWKNRFKALGRQIRWLFPDKNYMTSLYPVLEKMIFLLPFCWIRRDIKLIWIMIHTKNEVPEEVPEMNDRTDSSEVAKYRRIRSISSTEDIGYSDDPFRTDGKKKAFYRGRTGALEEGVAGDTEAEELPLNKDYSFLSEEINEEEEANEGKETDLNLWDFKAASQSGALSTPSSTSSSSSTSASLLKRNEKENALSEEEIQKAYAQGLPREMDTEPDPFVNREAAPEQSGVWDSIPKKEHTDDPSSAIFGKLSAEDEDKAVGALSSFLDKDSASGLSEEEIQENIRLIEARYRQILEGSGLDVEDTKPHVGKEAEEIKKSEEPTDPTEITDDMIKSIEAELARDAQGKKNQPAGQDVQRVEFNLPGGKKPGEAKAVGQGIREVDFNLPGGRQSGLAKNHGEQTVREVGFDFPGENRTRAAKNPGEQTIREVGFDFPEGNRTTASRTAAGQGIRDVEFGFPGGKQSGEVKAAGQGVRDVEFNLPGGRQSGEAKAVGQGIREVDFNLPGGRRLEAEKNPHGQGIREVEFGFPGGISGEDKHSEGPGIRKVEFAFAGKPKAESGRESFSSAKEETVMVGGKSMKVHSWMFPKEKHEEK
ncbi:nucleotidyltransferase family protein [Oribacterium parvum]|uniref:nucleotidyltransferase family protein n=1 Tax=Oribacterium parvum TaxID=1501329 RepID=UPI0028F10455|nr:nucleotidyltransferase family protein [Oribacterium parvum]